MRMMKIIFILVFLILINCVNNGKEAQRANGVPKVTPIDATPALIELTSYYQPNRGGE
jgi:hypothetical protein